MDKVRKLIRRGRMIEMKMKFWTFVYHITKFGPHGLACRMIRSTVEEMDVYNRKAMQCNREQRRVIAAHLKGGRK